MALKPDVLWAQRPDSVYLTIDLKDVTDMKVTLEKDSLNFSGKANGNLYEFTLEFFAPIKKQESKWNTKRLIEFYMKKEEAATWPRLTQAKTKFPWIKVDWKRWQDSDDEGGGKKGGFDVDGMGDMNFGDMGGGDDLDSDDDEEELPDLEPAEAPGADSSKGGATSSASGADTSKGAADVPMDNELGKID